MARRRLKLPDQSKLPIILERLAAGESMNAICSAKDMPDRGTVRAWCDADRALAEQVFQAREIGFYDRAERAVAAAKSATNPQLGRLAFDAERWFLGKLSIAFAERPPRIETQNNLQVNLDVSNPFGQLAEFMDRAAATIASGARSTILVADESETGPGSA